MTKAVNQVNANDIARNQMLQQLKVSGVAGSLDIVKTAQFYCRTIGLTMEQDQARDVLRGLIADGLARANHEDITMGINVFLTMKGHLA